MSEPTVVSVRFGLDAPGVGLQIEVRIRSFGDRWMAVADIAGEQQVGLGRTARDALEAALASLGARVTRVVLADLQLLAPSVEILRQERSSA